MHRTPAVKRSGPGRPRRTQPTIVQNQNENAQFSGYRQQTYQPPPKSPRYQAYQAAPKSPRIINGRIQKATATSPQSPRGTRGSTTRSGRRYSPATLPGQDDNVEDRDAARGYVTGNECGSDSDRRDARQFDDGYQPELEPRRQVQAKVEAQRQAQAQAQHRAEQQAQAQHRAERQAELQWEADMQRQAQAQFEAEAEVQAQQQAYAQQAAYYQQQHDIFNPTDPDTTFSLHSRPSFTSTRRSSHSTLLSKARNIFLADPRSKPILHRTTPKLTSTSPTREFLYYAHLNDPISSIRSPYRHLFLERQARIDDRRSSAKGWGGFGEEMDLPTAQYGAMRSLGGDRNRVERYGRGLRLWERRDTLDGLGEGERRELIEWWAEVFGDDGGRRASTRDVTREREVKKERGWADKVWSFVKQRKWNGNNLRRKKVRKASGGFNRVDALRIGLHGSKESADSWESDMAAAYRRVEDGSAGRW
ncbi:hypothetical protein PMZ80_008223 [Knufia obscura]|uniref:Uncharacterized protein n=1 Tax=Knufia obscura TaxID=1635080 RepID=A0ABR0RGS4_9EURO|nr:hypothetical protein PMZ80_008223 [Knufia obscura]